MAILLDRSDNRQGSVALDRQSRYNPAREACLTA